MPDYRSIYYPEIAFGGYSNVDGTVVFHQRIRNLMTRQSVVLDIGCGRGGEKVTDPCLYRRDLWNHRGHCAKMIGIDPNPGAVETPLVDEFHVINDLKHWPVESSSVDVAIADFVLEHVEDVESFFSECRRVVKPGGYLCIRTPNLLSYIGLIAYLTPNRYHAPVVTRLHDDRQEFDVFPTYHRCNTRGKLRRTLKRHGFEGCVYGYEAEPSYHSFSRIFYMLAVWHSKWAPDIFKLTLQSFVRRIGDPAGSGVEGGVTRS